MIGRFQRRLAGETVSLINLRTRFAKETTETILTYVGFCSVGEEASRFRDRAIQCRMLADAARDAGSRLELSEMAQELDEEADRIEAEEADRQTER